VAEIVAEAQPGILSKNRKVMCLNVHDVSFIFKTAKQAFDLPQCFAAKSLSSLTSKGGQSGLFKSRKSKAARHLLVNEDTAKWPPQDPQLQIMF
jgi:hypothetical protein